MQVSESSVKRNKAVLPALEQEGSEIVWRPDPEDAPNGWRAQDPP